MALTLRTKAKAKVPSTPIPTSTSGKEGGLTKTKIISELTRSPHGDLDKYLPVGLEAARTEPEFFAHLIAWNEVKGQVRDAKLALPVCQLSMLNAVAAPEGTAEHTLIDNALAHLAKQSPRDLVRALKFAKGKVSHSRVAKVAKRYVHEREKHQEWWDRTVLAHRRSMRGLYKYLRIKPSPRANAILFEGVRPAGSVFEALYLLSRVSPSGAADLILEHNLPFLSIKGALNGKVTGDLGLALVESMSPTQLVTNTKMLEDMGMSTDPAMRAAYEVKLREVAKSSKATLKTTRAAGKVSEKTGEKLKAVQEKQLDAMAVKGNWLVLADKSGSMSLAIETARQVAAILSRVVDGEVHLVFFDTAPRYINATKRDYDWISKQTELITARGGTSIGCGLHYALVNGLEVDGIAVISDANENSVPFFAPTYANYMLETGRQPPVYLYRVGQKSGAYYADTDLADSMRRDGHDMQEFDLRGGVDYASLPNIVLTMRTNRYSLVDEVYNQPLLTLDQVFSRTA